MNLTISSKLQVINGVRLTPSARRNKLKVVAGLFLLFLFSFQVFAQEMQCKAKVIDDHVRLRQGPELLSSIIDVLESGTSLQIISRSKMTSDLDNSRDYWFNVKTNSGQVGWVYGKYIGYFNEFRFSTYTKKLDVIDGDGHITNIEGKSQKTVTFKYPAIWENDFSVFTDIKGNKIAEITPGLRVTGNLQNWFRIDPNDPSRKILKDTELRLPSGRKIRYVLELTEFEGGYPKWTGIWYPNRMVVTVGKIDFGMSFYSLTETTNDIELWKIMVDSVRISD